MSNESTLLYVWIKSLTKIYCILKSYEKVNIEYFTEDNFIFQFFLSHFNLNYEDYRSELSLKDKLIIMKSNLKRFLEGYGYHCVTLLNQVFNNYHFKENKMKIWKMIFTVTFLEDFALLCKRFMQYNEKSMVEKSFFNTEIEVSVLNYNQNIPKKLTIRSMIKSPILLKLSLAIAHEILSECEVGFTDLENLIHSNFNEALNESRFEEVYHMEIMNSPNGKSPYNEMNNSNNISFTNNKSEILKEEYINNGTNQVYFGVTTNMITEGSYISREEIASRRNIFSRNNYNYDRKHLHDERSRNNLTLNNNSEKSEEKSMHITEDYLKNDNFELTLKRHINAINIFPPVIENRKCEKCDIFILRIEDLEKQLEKEKQLYYNLNNSIKKYEEENSNLMKYNTILVNEKNTMTTNLKSLEKKINMLSVLEKQCKEKENENHSLQEKVEKQEDLIQNLQDKIFKYEDQILLMNEYKIKLIMMQNEVNKMKKEMEIASTKPKEIKSVEGFTINRIIENISKSEHFIKNSKNEGFNYIENVNIYNDNKSQEIQDFKNVIAQSNTVIEQLKMKLTECKSIISYKENQIKTLEGEVNNISTTYKKRDRMIKTLQSSLAEKTKELGNTYFVLKWTYILISIIIACLMIFKAI